MGVVTSVVSFLAGYVLLAIVSKNLAVDSLHERWLLTPWIMFAVNVEDRLNSYVAYLTCKFSCSLVCTVVYIYLCYDTIKGR